MKFYRKAIVAFIVPLVAALGAAMQDGGLTGKETIAAVGLALVTAAAVYQVPNQPRP